MSGGMEISNQDLDLLNITGDWIWNCMINCDQKIKWACRLTSRDLTKMIADFLLIIMLLGIDVQEADQLNNNECQIIIRSNAGMADGNYLSDLRYDLRGWCQLVDDLFMLHAHVYGDGRWWCWEGCGCEIQFVFTTAIILLLICEIIISTQSELDTSEECR